jgi:hypothetical protein
MEKNANQKLEVKIVEVIERKLRTLVYLSIIKKIEYCGDLSHSLLPSKKKKIIFIFLTLSNLMFQKSSPSIKKTF